MTPPSNIKIVIISFMHPGPIGRGLSLHSNLFDLDYTETKVLPEEEAWDSGAGANPVCPGGVHLGEGRDNRVQNPIANRWQGLPRC